jgi:aminomethyltransferase
VEFLEHVVVGDIAGLGMGSACLSLITNETGGILDDTVITNAGDHIYMVVNGATKHDDMAHFASILASDAFVDKDVTMEYLGDEVQLLAVQGPAAAAAVSKLLDGSSTNAEIDLTRMPFMSGAEVTLAGIPNCRITRYVRSYSDVWCRLLLCLVNRKLVKYTVCVKRARERNELIIQRP